MRGLDIKNEYFSSAASERKYDLIIMSHVFEHIEKLNDFLKDLSRSLNNNGAIMFTQTNYKGLLPRLQKEKWYAWVAEQHYWHFTLKGLTKLLYKNNAEIMTGI